ncbi:MAG: DNA adenine methylase [Bacteroidales bacterium]|nr:DNA adenine methylase [Bacteroidales bacterium]
MSPRQPIPPCGKISRKRGGFFYSGVFSFEGREFLCKFAILSQILEESFEVMYQIGGILKAVREQKGVQLTDVQTQTGINLSQLSRIENGKRLPTTQQLKELSLLYGIDSTTMQIQRQSDRILTALENPEYGLESLAVAREKILHGEDYISMFCDAHFTKPIGLSSRRYIGSKAKLLDWIFETIDANTERINTFCDIFAGTGVVANAALSRYQHVIMNDLLYSNNLIYKAFFAPGEWDKEKVALYLNRYNSLNPDKLRENYFSKNFGGKFFEASEAKRIGYIRQDIENHKKELTEKEYHVLIATLIYNIDKIANTLGHFEAYIRKPIEHKPLCLKLIDAKELQNVEIFREDSNKLAKRIHCDLVYIDPPYNSRQYSRFYHVYETLVKWNKPKLSGVAMKPPQENMSDYCSSRAGQAMRDLVTSIDARYIVVSYNNTYKSKSSSSENKIQLDELTGILNEVGETQIFEHGHRAFNAGKTEFADHKEFLFVTRKYE